jgi:hypothetical protein
MQSFFAAVGSWVYLHGGWYADTQTAAAVISGAQKNGEGESLK